MPKRLLVAAFLFCLLLVAIPGCRVSAVANNAKSTIDTIINPSSFASYTEFEKTWNYLYPWGADHNGSARMVGSTGNRENIALLDGNILRITASYITNDEGSSPHNPRLKIKYHSGAIHAKHKVLVSDSFPKYELSGLFKAPTAKGTWPAFWITAVKGWPPEADILEFKGDSLNWQNTFIIPNKAATIKVPVTDAATSWHQYKAVLKKLDSTNISIEYYLDDKFTGVHQANFMNKPMWIIINLQMEGSSGGPGPTTSTEYFIKDVVVTRSKKV